MAPVNKKESIILIFGDIVSFYAALFLMLVLRYSRLPDREIIDSHIASFSIIFIFWIVVFFIAGLYEKHTLILRSRVGNLMLRAQMTNSALAALFFYLIPYFGITPKTNLFIDLVLSFAIVVTWRLYLFPAFQVRKKENAILIGSGTEMLELEREVNNNPRYDLQFITALDLDGVGSLDFKEEVLNRMYSENASIVAADFHNEKIEPLLPNFYSLIFSKVKFIDIHRLYEDIFDRIPLSLIKYDWFFEHVSGTTSVGYDVLKRGMDILLAGFIGLISLIFYPFVFVAIKLEDRGPMFFAQERVGRNGQAIIIRKFRSIAVHNEKDGIAKDPKPTKVGKFLRTTRIDELPQIWNVLSGDLSLIGPRPEIPKLVKLYAKEIPYYNVRHLVSPGLSGWAQLYGEHGHGVAAVDITRNKLSYDLYYVKNRSLMLDLKIALRTIKTILSREGA